MSRVEMELQGKGLGHRRQTLLSLLADHIARTWSVNVALADQAMVSAVNFLTGLMLARILGFEEFGRFALAWTIITSVNIVQQALIIDPMLSIGAKQADGRSSEYFGTVLLHQLVLSVLLAAAVIAGLDVVCRLEPDWHAEGLALPLAASMTGYQWQETFRRHFLARDRIGMVFVNDAIRYLLQFGILCAAFLGYGGITSSAEVLWIIAAAAAIAIAQGVLSCGGIRFDRAVIRQVSAAHWRFSRWLLPSATLQAFNGAIFISAAGYWEGAAVAGALRAAQNLVAFANILFLGLENTMQVRSSRAYAAEGMAALRHSLVTLWAWGGLLTGVLLVGFCLAAHWLIRIVYGAGYEDIAGLVYLWAAAYALHFVNMPLRIGIRALERTQHLLNLQIAVAVFSLVSVYPLVRYGAAPGVLAGTIIARVIEFGFLAAALQPILRGAAPAPGRA